MTEEEIKEFFNPDNHPRSITLEELYRVFKTRLMQECSVVPRWTVDEWVEWKKKTAIVCGE